MGLREEALFINGIYKDVLTEILGIQKHVSEHIMFLQPYSSNRIAHIAKNPPSVDDRVRLFLSVTDNLAKIEYAAEIVGWVNKIDLEKKCKDRWKTIDHLIKQLKREDDGLYLKVGDRKCVNLLSIWRLEKLKKPFSVGELILTSTGKPHSTNRTTPGGWSYVKNPGDEWLRPYMKEKSCKVHV